MIEIENGNGLSADALLEEGLALVERAAKDGVVLRLVGALGVRIACPRSAHLFELLGRRTRDVDLAGLGKQWSRIVSLFESAGYVFDERRALAHGSGRLLFYSATGVKVDVFLDRLRMCHEIDMRPALLGDEGVTLSPAELLLQKLQIVELTRNDVVDLVVLLHEHDVAAADRVARRLADDWGFWYTATQNLEHLRDQSLAELPELSSSERELVRKRTEALLRRLEEEPKTLRWKVRAAIGRRARWYEEVGDVDR